MRLLRREEGETLSDAWAWTLGSVALVSLLSLSGAATLLISEARFRKIVLVLVSFAAGALLADAFLHLIPELAEEYGLDTGLSLLILGGLGSFFVIEKFLRWHHAHFATEDVIHPVAVTNLVGDSIHNFIDGALIAGAFLADTRLGVGTTIAVALHEIPQEIGDLGILVHAGMTRKRALVMNLFTAMWAIAGAVLALLVADAFAELEKVLLAMTAGGFIYIAGANLIPELQRETKISVAFTQLFGIGGGVALMAALTLLE